LILFYQSEFVVEVEHEVVIVSIVSLSELVVNPVVGPIVV